MGDRLMQMVAQWELDSEEFQPCFVVIPGVIYMSGMTRDDIADRRRRGTFVDSLVGDNRRAGKFSALQ